MKTKNIYIILLCLVAILGSCTGDDKFDPNKNYLMFTGTEREPFVQFQLDDTPSSHTVTTSSTRKLTENAIVYYEIDNAALEEYNQKNKTTYFAVPESSVKLLENHDTIYAGKAASTGARAQIISTEDWVDGRTYVVPVSVKNISGGSLEALNSSKTVFLKVSRKIMFSSLDVSDNNLYSEFLFEKSKQGFTPIDLPQFTCEIKVYLTESKPGRIRRLCNWGGVNGQNMLRFGESGMDGDQLQWVSPAGSIPSKTLFSPNRWYTVSLTFDGSRYTMYVDGVKDNEINGGDKSFKFTKFEIGMSWAGYTSSQRVRGRISEIKLWKKALVSSEIQLGMCGLDPKTEGLVAYWKMNETSGAIFHDATGNGYDIDWSDTWRSPKEDDVYQPYNKSSYVKWLKDEKNECYQ
ncbi:LamG-like jellyroll fold domain-containing protein [Dysgonomonas sp. BGC7]|uniref:BT_3987 domain-containing protein n=1 Tax=Dysgonomonas sp. BGC7 TaxID=1658008 RepID=UPI000682F55C|nr:LamG-like jellyroll fold domain-containing protein [Dysgonomonas sp. BGC7]MBD8389317.1 DUF1735 domain-containing protein [Dysgonomonas sp. BGC7]